MFKNKVLLISGGTGSFGGHGILFSLMNYGHFYQKDFICTLGLNP